MTGREIHDLLRGMSFAVRNVAPGQIRISDRIRAGDGYTTDLPNGSLTFTIGIKGIEDDDTEVPDGVAMVPIVTFFHEVCGHGGQVKYELKKDKPLSRVLGLSKIACLSSVKYYRGMQHKSDSELPKEAGKRENNMVQSSDLHAPDDEADKFLRMQWFYTEEAANQPFELAAQYMGLKSARNFLTAVYTEPRADELLLLYLDELDKRGVNVVHREGGYSNMNDVFQAFENAFEKSIYGPRDHYKPEQDPDGPIYLENKVNKKDILITTIPRLSDRCVSIFNNCTYGTHKDLMMSAVLHYNIFGDGKIHYSSRDALGNYQFADNSKSDHKLAVLFEQPVFENFNWSYGRIFKKYPPKELLPETMWPARLRLSLLHDMMTDVPAADKRARYADAPDMDS